MSAHEAPHPDRIARPDQCGCDEMPQLHYHIGRGAFWFACRCGRASLESQNIERAIYQWNQLQRRGEL